MIQVSIKKQKQITNQGFFPSMEEAQAWLTKHEGMRTFGQPKQIIQQQVELSPAVIAEDGSILQEAVLETKEIELAGDYDVEITNITSQLEQEKINAEALAFLADCDWKRQRHISQKALNIITSLSEKEYLAMEQECQAARERIVK